MNLAFNKIIIGYDDSEGSKNAIKLAQRIKTDQPDSKLIVVHVVQEKIQNVPVENERMEMVHTQGYVLDGFNQPVLLPPESTGHTSHAKITNSVDQVLFNMKQELKPYESEIHYELLEGNPEESICKYAEEVGADLIIVGTSGKSGIKKMFLGRVSEKIARNSHCHVLIAK